MLSAGELLNAAAGEVIHSVALRCQIQLEVARRQYSADDQERLRDLFGETERWGQTLKTMLWTHASVVAPAFQDTAVVDVPCRAPSISTLPPPSISTALPMAIFLSRFCSAGRAYADGDGALQVAPIPWDKEARFRLPVKAWREMMDIYYPNSAWLCLRRDVFERLYQYKVARGIPTWEQTLESILPPLEKAALEEAAKR